MPLLIRPADQGDYQAIAKLQSLAKGQNITAEELVADDQDNQAGACTLRVVGELDGEIIACGDAAHSVWNPPGLFRLYVVVSPEHRRATYGTALVAFLESQAKDKGATVLQARARETEPAGVPFLQSLGYEKIAHSFESVLDLREFDPSHFQVETRSLRIFTFAETGMDEAAKRRLWELNVETSRDEPMNDPNFRPTFEAFCANVINASWFDPAGQYFAAEGDEWIGMTAIGQVHPGSYYNLFTGVRLSHRGKGIAMALKVVATAHFKNQGGQEIRTNNDSRNAAMLAINSKLGYKPEPGWTIAQKASPASTPPLGAK